MAIATAVRRKIPWLGLASLLIAGVCSGQAQKWTWTDKSGRIRTRSDLDEILRRHLQWLDSDGETGERADLSGANLRGAELKQADLAQAFMSAANLTYADLASAKMSGADLRNAILSSPQSKSQLRRTGIPAPPGLLTGLSYDSSNSRFPCAAGWAGPQGPANLAHADLLNADLSGAHLEAANLDSSNLRGALLRGAFLTIANLSHANMTDASLNGASAENAVFESARLSNTDLTDANLAGVRFCETVFEPKALPTAVRGLASAAGLDLVTYDSNPDALVQLRKQFKDGGFEEQERKITYAIKRRQADMFRNKCSVSDVTNCISYAFNRVLFDLTCQYGMSPIRPLVLCFFLWLCCSFLYFDFIHETRQPSLYRLFYESPELKADPSAHQTVEPIRPSEIREKAQLHRIRAFLIQELSLLGAAMFFSLMSAFNIGFREIDFGRWLRLLTRKEFDIKATGWARVTAGWQALISVLLIALFLLTSFGRPFG
jgi:uncharacterized protein YjbI with pentapeptide repeats